MRVHDVRVLGLLLLGACQAQDRPDSGVTDTAVGHPAVEDTELPTVGTLVIQTLFGEKNFVGMAVSAFRAGPDGAPGDYLSTGWSSEAFAVESGELVLSLGSPDAAEVTADGYPVARYEGEGYVAPLLAVDLLADSQTAVTYPVNLLVGEKEYTEIKVDCYNLKLGGDGVYYRGEDWEAGWRIYDPWVHQRDAGQLVAENVYSSRDPFGFLSSGEWLEVTGNTLVLRPEGTKNMLREVQMSNDDFTFGYIDLANQYWCIVSAKAW